MTWLTTFLKSINHEVLEVYTVNSDLNKTINSHSHGSEEDKSDENNEKSEEGEKETTK